MTTPERHLVAAVAISTFVTLFNIAAVSNGSAETYYTKIEQFFSHVIHSN